MIVDIHAHYVSPLLLEEVRKKGSAYGVRLQRFGPEDREGVAFLHNGVQLRPFLRELCDLEVRLPYLDSIGVDLQMISAWTDMSGDDLPADLGGRWARLQNETLAADAKASGGRFEAMGTLPMQTVNGAVRELEHVVHGLGMRSIEMGTHVNGTDLDHPDLRSLWKRIAELNVFVLLHPPFKPVGLERTTDYFLNNLISYPTDTTIAAARLIFSGILADLPNLNICLAHGGGFLPYQIGRMDRGFAAHPACKKAITRPPSDFLRRFYFDTLTHNTGALDYLCSTVGADRLLYGSDYPFEMLDESGTARIREMKQMSAEEVAGVLGSNAGAMLAQAGKNLREHQAERPDRMLGTPI
jgi:aminocarboxymuconate-semialdehyde decarboxylase